jgi:hydrogenase expression/formation protein HypC
MCLATPMKLIRVSGEYGFVEHAGKEHRVSLSLIDEPVVGDYLLAHGEIAVSRVPEEDALEIIALIAKAETSQ